MAVKRARARHWRTRFGSFVSRLTVAGVCERLHAQGHPLTPSAVYNWVLGYKTPRAEVARALEVISGRSIRLRDIVEHRRVVGNGAGNAPHGSAPAEHVAGTTQ